MSKYDLEKTSAIANKVIALMQNNNEEWFKPFTGDSKYGLGVFPRNIKGNTYSGMNLFILLLENYQYKQNTWITFKKTKELGGQIIKGQKGTQIKFCGNISKKDSNGADEDYFVNKWYTVFNLDQTNLEEIKPELFQNNDNEMPLDLIKRDQAVDLFIKNTEAHIVHNKTGKCFYVPSKDMINMSPLDTWQSQGDISKETFYYSTLLHELTHWTGHKDRLARDINNGFGTSAYAFEELVAELGSAILCGMLGVSKQPMANHAQYLNNWITGLKEQPQLLLKACTQAQRAYSFLKNLQSNEKREVA